MDANNTAAETLPITNYELWLLMAKIHHDVVLVRQRELSPFGIPTQQLQVLRTIQAFGAEATLVKIAAEVERKVDVISRQAVTMEKDGLIKRTRVTPKSRLLRIELTEKGLEMLEISKESKAIDAIWSTLTDLDRRQVSAVLNKMLNSLKEHIPQQS